MDSSHSENIIYDAVILGGGPGGYVCAIRCAQYGLNVALVERQYLGGTCLNWGCIPTKALVASAKAYQEAGLLEEMGIKVSGLTFDFDRIMERKRNIVSNLRGGIEKILKARKIKVIRGEATLDGPGKILVSTEHGAETIEATNIVIATGSETLAPGPMALDFPWVIGSTEALDLGNLPDSIAIIGGGVIGCEFASILSAFGTKVTIVEALSRLLPREDRQLGTFLRTTFKKRGVNLLLGSKVETLEKNIDTAEGKGVRVNLENGLSVEASCALVAIGRRAVTSSLSLESVGVEVDSGGYIPVDDFMRTNVSGIYAIGDVTGKHFLAHTASHGGILAAAHISGRDAVSGFDTVPGCIFTIPEVASVGFSEDRLKELEKPFKIGRFPFAASGKAQASGHSEGFVKIMADPDTDLVLGGCIAGEGATDMIAEIALAMRNKLTLHQIADTIHAHPTMAEGVAEAAESAIGLPIHTFGIWFVIFITGLLCMFSSEKPCFSQTVQASRIVQTAGTSQTEQDEIYNPDEARRIAERAINSRAVRNDAQILRALSSCSGIVICKNSGGTGNSAKAGLAVLDWIAGQGPDKLHIVGSFPSEAAVLAETASGVLLFVASMSSDRASLFKPLPFLSGSMAGVVRKHLADPRIKFLKKQYEIEDSTVLSKLRSSSGKRHFQGYRIHGVRSSHPREDLFSSVAFVSAVVSHDPLSQFQTMATGILRGQTLECDFDVQILRGRMDTAARILSRSVSIDEFSESVPAAGADFPRLIRCSFIPAGEFDRMAMDFVFPGAGRDYAFALKALFSLALNDISYESFTPSEVMAFIGEFEAKLPVSRVTATDPAVRDSVKIGVSRGTGRPSLFCNLRGALMRWTRGDRNPVLILMADLGSLSKSPVLPADFQILEIEKWVSSRGGNKRTPLIIKPVSGGWVFSFAGEDADVLITDIRGRVVRGQEN
ncbi:MAG: dihydrolipoyl dehydrogenase [Candidatus Wallbacteria bacterium HGW-Wallbacteria-1]|jgi:dihydrolipoamide dehydrogenase|uniref:Dihydrolipoyl dehydrogenase n=1 Tax=Candidatus Wallbacteria bacterium HGW-Wallbacteria-1 TaxID=2013854 RepID=A0A2N1PS11_9BACT|nr:MAG: dihydrolipoyl dehydrogenase [Candidatus Wallbacteria bacterium HGW-Wallbacteria-1]